MKEFSSKNSLEIIKYLDTIQYNSFYNLMNYNASCIDQKCTYDTLFLVCDIVFNFININGGQRSFSHFDFFDDEYAINKITNDTENIGKAILKTDTENEFNKFFQQIFEMLAYANIFKKEKIKKRNNYIVQNKYILELLATDIESCVCFICIHVNNLIKCDIKIMKNIDLCKSGISDYSKNALIESVREWIKYSSNGKHKSDVSQISLKILNPIFYLYSLQKYNRTKGKKNFPQTLNDLRYIRKHPRYTTKDFQMTQKEHVNYLSQNYHNHEVTVWRKNSESVKSWNIKYNELHFTKIVSNISQKSKEQYICELSENIISSPDIHHIWMKNSFNKNWKDSPHLVENLIILDPNEHRKIPTFVNADFCRITFEEILPSQFNKILNFSEKNIGNYDPYNFYKLVCYIMEQISSRNFYTKLSEIDINFCVGEIDRLLTDYKFLLFRK